MTSATRTPVTDEVGDVLVVGAGPTGLVLALLLLRHGVRPRVIDAAPRIAPESRAVVVHARTLEIYRLLGEHPPMRH